MASTLETCANTAARPAAPAAGDTVYQEDTKQIITYDGSAWQTYNSNGVAVDDTIVSDLSPKIWLDPNGYCKSDAGGTTACVSGDPVLVWKDRSGNSIDFEQTTASQYPIWLSDSGNNNMPVLAFSYAAQLIKPASAAFGTTGTIFWVLQAIKYSGSNWYITYNSSNTGRTRIYPEGKFNTTYFGANNTSDATSDVTEGTAQIIGFRSGSPFTWTADGRALMASPGNAAGAELYSAAQTYKIGYTTASMLWYDFIAFDSELSDANYNAVQGYLGDKYGITVADI